MATAAVRLAPRERPAAGIRAFLRRRRRQDGQDEIECEFPSVGGPLVAVVGLCGGAGASTLSCLLAVGAARAPAARSGHAPVLVCDAGAVTGGVAVYLGVESPASLGEVSDALSHARALTEGLFAETDDGLRVIATRARFQTEGAPNELGRLLTDARDAHGLTVVDCGTLTRAGEHAALRQATHVAWILPASRSGTRRARQMLADIDPTLEAREIVVARRDIGDARSAPFRRLAEIAADRGAPLVLMPRVPDLVDAPLETCLHEARLTLTAVATFLRRGET